jgi:hypothetical protein
MHPVLVFLLLALALAANACVFLPRVAAAAPHFDFPFHRIGARIGMLALLLGFVRPATCGSPTAPAWDTGWRAAPSCRRWRRAHSSGS